MLSDLFISKTRIKLLQTFLSNPGRIFYVRELVRLIGEQINAVRAELHRMEKAGMVQSENRANRKYYSFKRNYLFYDDLLRMISKTIGLGGLIIREKAKLGKIQYATLSLGFVRGKPSGNSDVDLLIVGNVVLPQLAAVVKETEAKLNREINYTVMTEDEFSFRKKRKDPFIVGILQKSKLMLIGDEEAMIDS